MSTDDDATLAAAARNGSAAAFEELVRRYQQPLLRFLRRRGPSADAEDVLQEAFLRAHRNLGRYRDGLPFKPWLFTIAHRLSIDAARRSRARPTALDPPPVADPSRTAERTESAERLWATVRASLADEPFTAVWLHYADGLTPRQVAAVMGRSWPWVRTTLHRARRRLAEALAPPDQGDRHAR